MSTIVKGDAYSVAFTVKSDDVIVTPDMVQGLRIALGNQIAEYPNGNLTFSSDDNTWRFPMTQKNTLSIKGKIMNYQSQAKIAGEIYTSDEMDIEISETMFRKEWV